MKIQWEKVPERIHSESLKCLFCTAMARTLQRTGDFKTSWTFCCSLMVVALTMDDDEAFKSEAKLMQALRSNVDFHDPLNEDETAFMHQHKEYFLECTSRVLKSVKNCPDKPYNRRRHDA
ncbi:hypothetical protein ES703_09610 [subsurface metagenome]